MREVVGGGCDWESHQYTERNRYLCCRLKVLHLCNFHERVTPNKREKIKNLDKRVVFLFGSNRGIFLLSGLLSRGDL